MTNPVRRPIAPQIIAIGMSLVALAAMLEPHFHRLTYAEISDMALPHGLSLLLRVVLCASCAYLAFWAAEASKRGWVWILGAAAFVYNPVIPLRLGYEISFVVLAVTVIILVATFWALRTSPKVKTHPEQDKKEDNPDPCPGHRSDCEHLVIQDKDGPEKKAKRKRKLLDWFLWWRIDQDELKKQLAEYESMRITRSAKGQSFLLLIFSACATTAFIAFANLSAVNFYEVLICLALGYFIYRGHQWATIAAMVLWSIEKLTAIWKPVGSSSFNNTGAQLVWWSMYMHAFYVAFRVERLRRRRESSGTQL